MSSEGEAEPLLPARMLNEFVYCPRLFFLEWVQGEFQESVDTLEGSFIHRTSAKPVGSLEATDEKIHARSVYLSAADARLVTKIDILEGDADEVHPIEYKKGQVPDNQEHSWEPDRIQLCAQGIVLRENGFRSNSGVLYYSASKERVRIEFSEDLVQKTREMIESAFDLMKSGKIPNPLVDSPKCPRCSLVGICLPDETNALGENTSSSDDEVRRMFPARDDALPMYVTEQGAVVGKSGEVLEVRLRDKVLGKTRLIDLSQLCVFGRVQVTASAIQALCNSGRPVCYYSFGGWFYGTTQGMPHKNIELRIAQYRTAADAGDSLGLARSFVEGKIRNCRTMVRRNHPSPGESPLSELRRLADLARSADTSDTLRGIEGAAANVYFSNFDAMIKSPDSAFDFRNRNRRPPIDPTNALLSFLYSLLTKDMTIILTTVGFDPYLGFYHTPRYGRPALALDLMEEFRPLIADSTLLALLNRKEITNSDFVTNGRTYSLVQSGKKKVIEAYHRRLDAFVTHPIFGYSISYGRVLEVQARLLGRRLSGELSEYPSFQTR